MAFICAWSLLSMPSSICMRCYSKSAIFSYKAFWIGLLPVL